MNENVTLIPARKKAGNNINKHEDKPKLKVAAYCRVSTDSDEQAGSYEVQVAHYTDYINRNKDWELAGIYADDGISGTNTKKREKFNEMIEDCMAGKVDLVITKSISRFARNTVDCLKYVRKLRDKNIPIIFEKENINTMEASGELLLTIMASLAQQESQSLSQNVKLGLQFRYQKGQVQVNTEHFLGYTKDENGTLVIEPEEAKIVKRIYYEYLNGASLRDIAQGLENDAIKTGGKKSKWHLSTIRGILKNEKYIGDALLQKTITTDFIDKTRIKNDGSYPQYYVTGSQEAIIPRDLFTQVQEEMARRSNMLSGDNKKKRVYSSKYALSSLCTCTKCGDIYRRTVWSNRGKKYVVWRCCTRMLDGPNACDAPTITEEELQQATIYAINKVVNSSSSMKEILLNNIKEAIANDNSDQLKEINDELLVKQKELVKLVQTKKDYGKIIDEVDELKLKKQQLLVDKSNTEGYKKRIEEMEQFLQDRPDELTEYNELMVRKYISEIKIYEDKFQVIFKAGIIIEVDR